MILKNRLFEREEPSEEAKSIFVFCEGSRREYDYFRYFKEIDSRINVEVYKLHPHEDNSPRGLLNIAKDSIIKSEHNSEPRYDFQDGDQVWLVFDIDPDKFDSREGQIHTILEEIDSMNGWEIARSNPCFEVWLYYHTLSKPPELQNPLTCSEWKTCVNNAFSGGFDSRKHPLLIEDAVRNSKVNFKITGSELYPASTEVYIVGESILNIVQDKIQHARKRLGI